MSTAKNLAAALDTQSDRRAGGVQYLTAKNAAKELIRLDSAVAELADALQSIIEDIDNPWATDYDYSKARAAIAKYKQENT